MGTKTYEEFCKDDMLQAALVRELEIIGEAASKLSEEYRRAHSQVPWREIIDLRNKLIHDYFGVNLEMVWEIYSADLPPLKQQIHELLG